jgi:hypothetical protein
MDILSSLMSFIFAINGSDIINQPYNTTFASYIRVLGQGWIIVPFAFIGAALFAKTRDTAIVSIYLVAIGAFIGAGSAWAGYTGAALLFFIMAALGIAALMYNVFYGGR